MILYCWFRTDLAPNISGYHEVDFASKCRSVDGNDDEMGRLLDGLGNTDNENVEKRMTGKYIFVGRYSVIEEGMRQRVIVSVKQDSVLPLEVGNEYL